MKRMIISAAAAMAMASTVQTSIREDEMPDRPKMQGGKKEAGGGIERAAARLEKKRAANLLIPVTSIMTRQRRRATERAIAKSDRTETKKRAMKEKWIGGAAAVTA